ncbi:MAG: hypothetical protein EUB_03436 [Eubacterium sp.]|uniref:hypothetical protein n=1 Tax=Eubacterium sp. TaxID=142586 RepID=UPI00302BB9F8
MAEEAKEVKKERTIKPVESTYTLDDFINSKFFNCPPECVVVAFEEKGITQATEKEAKKIVNEFLKREVK